MIEYGEKVADTLLEAHLQSCATSVVATIRRKRVRPNLPQKPPRFPRNVPSSSGSTSLTLLSEYDPCVRSTCKAPKVTVELLVSDACCGTSGVGTVQVSISVPLGAGPEQFCEKSMTTEENDDFEKPGRSLCWLIVISTEDAASRPPQQAGSTNFEVRQKAALKWYSAFVRLA